MERQSKACEHCGAEFYRNSRYGDERWQKSRFCSSRCHGLRNRLNTRERLYDLSMPEPMSGCWLWLGSVNKHGYGILGILNKTRTAHRVSYEEFKGRVGKGLCVLHRCDTPCCINPDHLFLGTFADNMHDMIRKNRQRFPVGTETGNAKLTDDQVRQIRKDTRKRRIVAAEYGVSQATISRIVTGEGWRHVQ